jgi:hypothetical protein
MMERLGRLVISGRSPARDEMGVAGIKLREGRGCGQSAYRFIVDYFAGWVVEFYTEFLLVNAASLKFSHACAFYEVLTPSEKDCSHGHCLDSNHPCTNRNGRGSILSASRIYSCDYPAQCRRNGLDAPKRPQFGPSMTWMPHPMGNGSLLNKRLAPSFWGNRGPQRVSGCSSCEVRK